MPSVAAAPPASSMRQWVYVENKVASDLGQLALRRPLSAQCHAPGHLKLRPASASQPLWPLWHPGYLDPGLHRAAHLGGLFQRHVMLQESLGQPRPSSWATLAGHHGRDLHIAAAHLTLALTLALALTLTLGLHIAAAHLALQARREVAGCLRHLECQRQWLGAQWAGLSLEARAAQSRQARPEEAQDPRWGTAQTAL